MSKFTSNKYKEIVKELHDNGYEATFIGSKGFNIYNNHPNGDYELICNNLLTGFKVISKIPYGYTMSLASIKPVIDTLSTKYELITKLNKLLDQAKEDDNITTDPVNEYATYEEDVLTAKDIMKELTWTNNDISHVDVVDASNNPLFSDSMVTATYELNEDDLQVEKTSNVTYVYFNLDNLDISLKIKSTSGSDLTSVVTKLTEVIDNLRVVPTEANRKAFRDNNSTYLLKINNNTGIISLFDVSTGIFKRTEFNYNSMTVSDIAKLILTPEYIQSYFDHVITRIESTVSMDHI